MQCWKDSGFPSRRTYLQQDLLSWESWARTAQLPLVLEKCHDGKLAWGNLEWRMGNFISRGLAWFLFGPMRGKKKNISVWINHEKKKSPLRGSLMNFVVLPEFLTRLVLAPTKMQIKQVLTTLLMIFFSAAERFLLCHLRSGLRDAAREGWMESSFFLLSLCILISAVFSPTPFTGMKISFPSKDLLLV